MEQKFHFTPLKSKDFNIFTAKGASDYFLKWSIKGQIKLATFCFNESFQLYQKKELIENFFHDSVIIANLNNLLPNWPFSKDSIVEIRMEIVPCTISSMSFFDRILDEENGIVRSHGAIRHCLDDIIQGFPVADELRKMLIDEEDDKYGLFVEKDRNEFIFRLFQFLVIGGKWCQYEDTIYPYLDLTKILYKDLVRVEKNPVTKQIEIRSICVKITLMGKNEVALFPSDAYHIQNFAYLIIDPCMRQITVFAHEYGGQF